jgi:PAS domain S-box-containing protein
MASAIAASSFSSVAFFAPSSEMISSSHADNISERKQLEDSLRESELRYRTVADFTSDWEYWILPDDTLRYVSPSCEQISGYSADEFYADPQLLTRVIHPGDQHLFAGHTHHLSAKGIPEPIDYRIRTKAGETIWISHACRPVHDHDGRALGQRASNRDITERKQAEDELKRFSAELELQARIITRTNADLQRFADVTAHHLQEPARRMASYAQFLTQQLGDKLDDDAARLSLEFIGQQARRQQNLLRDVERYLAAGQPRGEVKALDAGRIVKASLARMAGKIDKAGADITLGNLPSARIDALRLNDAFAVALDNALTHGKDQQPLRILIKGERLGNQVRFSISDFSSWRRFVSSGFTGLRWFGFQKTVKQRRTDLANHTLRTGVPLAGPQGYSPSISCFPEPIPRHVFCCFQQKGKAWMVVAQERNKCDPGPQDD